MAKPTKSDIIPILHENKPKEAFISIKTDCGKRFYATNIQNQYRYDERMVVISNLGKYVDSLNNPCPKAKAYSVLLWHLFRDFLNAYTFSNRLSNGNSNYKGDIYVLRNSLGFIKIGRTKNIGIRLIDLRYEFDGNFEIVKIYNSMGYMENKVLIALQNYQYPVIKRWTNKFSIECFKDTEAVFKIIEKTLL